MVFPLAGAEGPGTTTTPDSANLLRNGGFELGDKYNGGDSLRDAELILNYLRREKKLVRIDAEGWWSRGTEDGSGIVKEAFSEKRALHIRPCDRKPVTVFSAPTKQQKEGTFTLSAWIKTRAAQGKLRLELVDGTDPGRLAQGSKYRQTVALPTDSDWTRLRINVSAAEPVCARAVLEMQGGEVWADDVQIEAGKVVTDYDVATAEILQLRIGGVDETELPIWGVNEIAAGKKKITVQNNSRRTLTGDWRIEAKAWNQTDSKVLSTREGLPLAPEETADFQVDLSGLEPEAYLLSVSLRRGGRTIFDGAAYFNPKALIGGANSMAMVCTRGALRFVVAEVGEPRNIFGVGNGMPGYGWSGCEGSWYSGWPMALYAASRNEGFCCLRGQYNYNEIGFLLGAAGLPIHRMERMPPERTDESSLIPAAMNPSTSGGLNLWHPEGWKQMRLQAERIGRENARNPLIVSYQMANETVYSFRDCICPTLEADASFRAWCRHVHGNLDILNRHWKTAYRSWDEVEQPVSARFVDEVRARPTKNGAEAIDWTAAMGRITPEIQKRIMQVPGRGMDWCRWRTYWTLKTYAAFRESARQHDKKTLYSTNLCWPNFWPQMAMPFYRMMDVTMLDMQYTAGLPHNLGTPAEMLEILEMFESNAPDKPIWGIEIYVQPQNPPEFVSLQNWGMVAHGMSNNLVFGWGPYSDHGVPKTTRAWEKPDAKAMWMLIDKDGTRLPHYTENRRSGAEIAEFNRKYDALGLRRVRTEVAVYSSNDTNEYNTCTTSNKPYCSAWQHSRTSLFYLLRMSGVAADYVDDQTLPDQPGNYRYIIVPAGYVISQNAAKKLADFAQAGGTLVLAGPSGLVDPWLNRYGCIGGPAWQRLGWRAPKFSIERNSALFQDSSEKETTREAAKDDNETPVFRGRNFGRKIPQGARAIFDSKKHKIGWIRPWGKGMVVAYGIFPELYSPNPHPSPSGMAWVGQWLQLAGIPISAVWQNEPSSQNATPKAMHGEGEPVVEVVVRERRDQAAKERFVFVLNQGGGGKGLVVVRQQEAPAATTDALNGATVPEATWEAGYLKIPLILKPWEYRVFRLATD